VMSQHSFEFEVILGCIISERSAISNLLKQSQRAGLSLSLNEARN